MKPLIIIFTLLVSNSTYGQGLPDSILVKTYFGGDYRSQKYGKGATDKVELLYYTYKAEEEKFNSEKIFQTRKLFIYIDEDFNTKNINRDSTITIFEDLWISKKNIEELIYWTNIENYENKVFRQYYTLTDSTEISVRDTLLVKKDIKLDDFNIQKDEIIEECLCENIRRNKKLNCTEISFKNLFNSVMSDNIGFKSISSYSQYVEVSFILEEKKVSLIQNYTGETNIKWRIVYNDDYSKLLFILNPYLNEIVNFLLPYHKKNTLGLLEFKNKSTWVEKIE